MKKLAFMFVAVVAMSFASCGGNKEAQPAAEETTPEVAEETQKADTAYNEARDTMYVTVGEKTDTIAVVKAEEAESNEAAEGEAEKK